MWNDGTTGKFNASLGFDGTDDYASTSGTIMLAATQATSSAFSWGGWFNPAANPVSDTLIEKNREFTLTTDASNKPTCSIWVAGAWSTAAVSSTALSLNSWQHVLCTYDGTTIKVYLDGMLVGTAAQNAPIRSLNYTPLTTGHNFTGSATYYEGLVDDIR
ncbi:MAG: LamG domain-containing protein, partial [Rhodoplanes sp.]